MARESSRFENLTPSERAELITELQAQGVSQRESEMIADGALFGLSEDAKRISNEMASPDNGIIGALGRGVEGAVRSFDMNETSEVDAPDPRAWLNEQEEARMEAALAGDGEARAEIEEEGGFPLEEFARNAALIEAEQDLAMISAELNIEVTAEQVDEWIAEYNRSAISPLNAGDIKGFISRMDDPKMGYVFQESVLGVNDDVKRYRIGLGGGEADYTYLDQNQQQFLNQLGLGEDGSALAVLGTKQFGLDLEESSAIAMTINSLRNDGARKDADDTARAIQEVRELQAQYDRTLRTGEMENGGGEGNTLGNIRRKRDEAQERLDRLNARDAQREHYATRTAAGSFEKYAQVTEQYGGIGALGLIGLFDEALAAKVYEGGGYDLTADERGEIRDILDDAGNVNMPGTTTEQMNAILYGNPTGAGPQTITYTAPDDSTLRESHRALYQSWFLSDPDDDALEAFVADMQGQVKAEAMKRSTGSRVNFFKQPNGAAGGTITVGLEDVDFANQQRENLRGNDQYADLFGKRPDGVSEEQYAGVFRNTANSFLGAEGVLATDAIKQGMRSGETAAVARLSMYDKKFRDNSTLLGRMAGASNSFARFT